MRNKLWRVPLVSIVTGVITSIISFMSSSIMAKGTSSWTTSMGFTIIWVHIIIASGLFIFTGFVCFKDMTKKEILKSSCIVSIYYLASLGIERLFVVGGHYPTLLLALFVPVDLYSTLLLSSLHFTNFSIYICIVPSVLMPILYTVFGEKSIAK